MITIAIISQKGGVGKTTLALALAAAARKQSAALVIDADPQATASQWFEWRGRDTPMVTDSAPTRIAAKVDAAREAGAQLVVIDTPPHSDSAATAAAKAADIVLIPCRPSAFDLDAIRTTLALAELARTPAFVVLTCVNPNATRHNAEARLYVETAGGQLAPQAIAERAAYRHAAAEGLTVLEYDLDGKASNEVRSLFRWVTHLAAKLALQNNREAA